jgi:outer membrane murein-binding lipoprotein Lpp
LSGETEVKLRVIAALVAGLNLCVVASAAAAPDELAEIRAQLQSLAQRVERLEQDNAALRAQNDALKSSNPAVAPAPPAVAVAAASQQGKPAPNEWASRIAARGDLRYRWERTTDAAINGGSRDDARYRDRIRARLGFDAKVTNDITATLLVATGGEDPRSANQTLGGANSRKAIGFDLAYFDWKYASWGNLMGGKMKYPFVRPGQSLFFDVDVNPEGLALGFNRGIWFGSGYSFWVEERATAADTMIYGGQVGARLPLGDANLMVALQYSDLSHGQGFRPYFNNQSNGNSTVDGTPGGALLYDFNVIELATELNLNVASLPLQLWANVAQNQDPSDLNLAWTAGLMLGKAASPRSWEVGAGYQVIEKDALFGQIVESDFADGRTDSKGWVFRTGYAPAKNWTLSALYFMTQRQVDVGTPVNGERLQVDFNLKF